MGKKHQSTRSCLSGMKIWNILSNSIRQQPCSNISNIFLGTQVFSFHFSCITAVVVHCLFSSQCKLLLKCLILGKRIGDILMTQRCLIQWATDLLLSFSNLQLTASSHELFTLFSLVKEMQSDAQWRNPEKIGWLFCQALVVDTYNYIRNPPSN